MVVIKTWVFGRHFDENKQSEIVIARKIILNIFANNKFQKFK